MSKVIKWTGSIAVLGIASYLSLVGYVYYHDKQRIPALTKPTATEQNAQVLTIFNEKGCDYCHTPSAKLPVYADWPIAKQLMAYDIKMGYRAFNFSAVRNDLINGTVPSETDLVKLQWVMEHKAMPPTRYVFMHWAGSMDDEERQTILDWIKEQRESHYTSSDQTENMRNEPVQPIPNSLNVNSQKAALGFRLFHDPRISGDNTVSCAHCHQLDAGGVDGLKTSKGVAGAVGPINAPTVFNAIFNIQQFWNGRAANLQEQAGGPPLNPIEMASKSWDEISAKLYQDKNLKKQFDAIYPGQGITSDTITNAIAEFEKTLITPNSPFDRYLRGDEKALTEQQKRGYQLFKDNRCATCHAGKNFGGLSYEPLGLRKDYNFGVITDADIGRMNVTKEERDRLRQKVPSLRNIELTAPYFHRGDVKTLDEAVKQMLEYQVGTTLSQKDVDDIVEFLKSLTGVYTPYQPQEHEPSEMQPKKSE